MKVARYRLFAVITLFVAHVLSPVPALGQRVATPYDGFTQAGLGGAPANEIDQVDLFTGALKLRIPLLQIGGRGTVGHTLYFSPDRPWGVGSERRVVSCFPSNVCTYTDLYYVSRDFGVRPGVVYARHAGIENQQCNGFDAGLDTMLTRLTFVASDGSETEMVDATYNGQTKDRTSCLTGHSRGTVWYSTDGSGMTFISDAPISDNVSFDTKVVSGNLMMRDGTKYRIDSGALTSIRDRNGNMITFGISGGRRVITDPLKREIEISGDGRDTFYNFKGFQSANRTISLVTESEPRLRPDFSSLHTNGSAFPGISNLQFPTQIIDPVTRVNRIVMPDNREYRIWHNDYGDIARVDLPTGGRIEYDYAGTGSQSGIYRRVVTRRVYLNTTDTIPSGETRYDDLSAGASVVVRRVVPGTEINLSYTKHYFFGSPVGSMSSSVDPTRYRNWNDGLEWKTESYDASGTRLIMRAERDFQPRVTHAWASFDPQLRSETATLADLNLVSRKTYNYDQYNNVTDVYEYDFGVGAPGPLIRRTHTSYLTTNLYQGGVNYATDLNIHIRNLPVQQVVYDAAGNVKSQTDYIYDNYDGLPLVDRPGIVQHDAGFHPGYGARGNLTGVIHYNPGGDPSEIHLNNQYDIAGNMVKVIDGRRNSTTIAYEDCFGPPGDDARSNSGPPELAGGFTYAFPTRVTNALTPSHTTYTKYDYYLGKPVNAEDANGVVSSVTYDDPLDRLTQGLQARYRVGVGVPAERRQMTISYDDANRVITTTSDRGAFNDNILTGKAYYDGLGRTRRGAIYEGSSWAITDTQFDALGRVSRVSNPYRAADPDSASPPDGPQAEWTTTHYDALGRVTQVVTPDGAHVDTAYSGNQVTVIDQAGRRRRSQTDALGRLIRVTEDPGNLNYETYYSYDTLDNLRMVTQGSQVRTFVYDSLSRLISATNPESGNMSYAYDGNGNLIEKTDNRGVKTTITYDALNRVKSKVYTGTPQGGTEVANATPPVNYFYDDYSTLPGGGPTWPTWSCGGQTLPNISVKGRLIGVTYGTGSDGTYYRYDATGKIIGNLQRMGTPNFVTRYTYNLAGAGLEECRGYSSSTRAAVRNISAYDDAGRLTDMRTSFTPHTSSKYLVQGMSYTPFGALQTEKYGNGLIHSIGYNNRLQSTEMRLGRPDNLESVFTIYNLHGTAANPNVQDPEITPAQNNGNIARIKYVISGELQYSQTFQYDPLNRLKYAVEHDNGAYNDAARAWYQTFEYDFAGNRGVDTPNTSDNVDGLNSALRLAEFSAANNRITRLGYFYDAAGNVIEDPRGRYTYDAENRLVTAEVVGGTTSQYAYDGNGKRVKKTVGGVGARFEYGVGGELIAERDDAGVVTNWYYYRDGQLLATSVNGTTHKYAASDHLGSPRAWTDDSGALIAGGRHDYLPFGEELFAGYGVRTTDLGYAAITQADGQRKQFDGYERDNETGLYFAQARYFAGVQGRFTSVDPTLLSVNGTNPQTWNRYAFVLNNPLRYTDPLGLWEIDTTPVYDKTGKLKRVVVYVKPSKEGDNAASLVKQLGYDPSSKDGQKLQASIEKQIGQYVNSETAQVNLAEVGGNVGRIYQAVEYGLTAQGRHVQKPGGDPGPSDPDYNDCSMTTCRIAFPSRMFDYGGMKDDANFGLQTADSLVRGLRSVSADALRVGDIIRYADERNRPQHFMNAIFTGDDGTSYAFSRSGVSGKFEIVPTNAFVGTNYGSIRGVNPGQTGFYRP